MAPAASTVPSAAVMAAGSSGSGPPWASLMASSRVSSRARALIWVSFSSASGTESYSSVAPARTARAPGGYRRGARGAPCFHRAVKADLADGAAVPAARGFFVVLDELHSPGLRRAGDGDRPHVGQHRVQRVELRPQPALDVIDG